MNTNIVKVNNVQSPDGLTTTAEETPVVDPLLTTAGTEVQASILLSLLEVLYVLVVDYTESGASKASPDVRSKLKEIAPAAIKEWAEWLPSLETTIKSVLSGKKKVENLVHLGQEIRDHYEWFKDDHSFTIQELELLRAIQLYLRTDSQPALNKLVKFAGIIRSPWISRKLAPEIADQVDSTKGLNKLLLKLVGREDTTLTAEEAQTVRETNPEAYKLYLAYRREFNNVWKEAMVSFIRNSGQSKVRYQDVLDFLEGEDIQSTLPVGFTGLVDDQGRMYTSKGELIEGVPNATSFPNIVMNPKYGVDSPWVFRADRPDGSPGPYFYTSAFKKSQSIEKFKIVEDLEKKIPGMRKKWFSALKKFDQNNPDTVAALAIELLYEFSARVGSTGNKAAGAATYGISTLEGRHFKIMPNGDILIAYKGKDGVATRHKVVSSNPEQKWVAAALKQLLSQVDPKERVFTFLRGNRKVWMSAALINAYFRKLGAGKASVHKLRTYHGSKLFRELLEEQMKKKVQPKNEKEALALLMKLGAEVGKKLNHIRTMAGGGTKVTGTTAIANYIDPQIQILLFQSLGFRVPKMLEKYVGVE